MAWSAGEILTAANLNTYLPQSAVTWSSPIAAGFTLGNGTVGGTYTKVGDVAVARLFAQYGSTSAVTGEITLTLPVTADTTFGVVGRGFAYDVSAGTFFDLLVFTNSSATVATVRPLRADTTYTNNSSPLSSTVPFTWATSDVMAATLTYITT